MNGEMLSLARRAAPRVAERVGFANVEFRRGRIQDLALDLDRLDAWLDEHPVKTSDDLGALESEMARLRSDFPLVPEGAVDLVLSNCVLNLVRPEAKPRLLEEIHRVVADGGRIAISDIVSDRPVPEHLMADPELWSGCVSGAFETDAMLSALEGVGFGDVRLVDRSEEPFALVEGIAFHAATIVGTKGEPRSGGCC